MQKSQKPKRRQTLPVGSLKLQFRRICRYIPMALWAFVIFLLSNQPASISSKQSSNIVGFIRDSDIATGDSTSTFLVRKSAHMFMYFVLGILLYALLRSYTLPRKKQIGFSILAAFCYAITDETHQLFIPGRSGEPRDVLIDTVGATLGVLVAIGISKLYTKYHTHLFPLGTDSPRYVYVRWVNLIMITGLVICLILAGIFAINSSLIAATFLIPIAVITSVFVGALCYMQAINQSTSYSKNAIMTSVSLISMALLIFATVIIGSASSFIGSLHGVGYEDQKYDIVAKTSSYLGPKQSNQQIGYIQNDPNNAVVLKELKNRTKAIPKAYDNVTALATALDTKQVNSLVIRDTYMQLLHENYQTFYSSIKIYDSFTVRVQRTPTKQADVTKPFVVYISGIDTYGNIDTVSRSDVNILAVVNPKTHKILLVNTPRDFYVQLHGKTGIKDKLTHAGIYGIDESESTMEDLYGTKIDYYIRINFNSLTNIVNTLGGVTVNSAQAFNAAGYKFVQGPNELDGKSALAFSRERHSFIEGDRTRGENQQRVITAIIEKLSKPSSIVKSQSVLKALEGSMQTDASDSFISSLIKEQTKSLSSWQVTSISVTGSDSSGPTYSMGNIPLYIMIPNEGSVNSAKAQIKEYAK